MLALVLLLSGCGPSVASTTAAETDPDSTTTDAGTASVTTGLGSSNDTAPDSTSTIGPDPSTGSSDGPAPEACMESLAQWASVAVESEVPYDMQGTCTVQNISGALHVALMDLTCESGEVRITSSEILGDFFEVGQILEIAAAGEPDRWRHLAIFDETGDFVMGSRSLSAMAPDFSKWLPPVEVAVVDTTCEDQSSGRDCLYHRVAVDYTFGERTQRAYDGQRVDFPGLRLHTYALLFDATDACPLLGPFGDIAMFAL